jgi:hypothetical protein
MSFACLVVILFWVPILLWINWRRDWGGTPQKKVRNSHQAQEQGKASEDHQDQEGPEDSGQQIAEIEEVQKSHYTKARHFRNECTEVAKDGTKEACVIGYHTNSCDDAIAVADFRAAVTRFRYQVRKDMANNIWYIQETTDRVKRRLAKR